MLQLLRVTLSTDVSKQIRWEDKKNDRESYLCCSDVLQFFLFILDLFSLLYKNRKMKAGRMNKDNMAVSVGCMRGTFCYLNRYLRRYTDVTHLMAACFIVLNEIIQKQNI